MYASRMSTPLQICFIWRYLPFIGSSYQPVWTDTWGVLHCTYMLKCLTNGRSFSPDNCKTWWQLQTLSVYFHSWRQCHVRSSSFAVLVLRLMNALLMLIHADQRLTPWAATSNQQAGCFQPNLQGFYSQRPYWLRSLQCEPQSLMLAASSTYAWLTLMDSRLKQACCG